MIDGFRFRLASAGLIYRDSPEVCAKASPQNYWPVRRAALIEFPRSKPSLMFPWNAKTFVFFFFFCHRSNEKGAFCILTSYVLTTLAILLIFRSLYYNTIKFHSGKRQKDSKRKPNQVFRINKTTPQMLFVFRKTVFERKANLVDHFG